MTTYEQAPQSVLDDIAAVIEQHHPHLHEVTFAVLMASNDKEGELALKVRGHRALATIKITSLDQRAAGMQDALLKIDKEHWTDAPKERQMSLLDHELTHLELVDYKVDEDSGQVTWKTDDIGRPKLRMRNHDFECGVFVSVMQRHGTAAVDYQVIEKMTSSIERQANGQLKFNWG